MGAVLSDCGRYRYELARELGEGVLADRAGTCLFVMLNPSTADASEDDPTIRRCIGFAERWGFERLTVGNLFALRSTDPKELLGADDPVGPDNDQHLGELMAEADLIIAAWGASTRQVTAHREAQFIKACRLFGFSLSCLGLTKERLPRHPLYLKGDAERLPFVQPASRSFEELQAA